MSRGVGERSRTGGESEFEPLSAPHPPVPLCSARTSNRQPDQTNHTLTTKTKTQTNIQTTKHEPNKTKTQFKTRPGKPTPLFLGFVLASGGKLDAYLQARATPSSSAQPTPTNAARAAQPAPSVSAVAQQLEGARLAAGAAGAAGQE